VTDPITPPPELVQQWFDGNGTYADDIRQAAQWGADQELEACCEYLMPGLANYLRNTRRPKPPSLKEQALGALHGIHDQGPTPEQVVIIRRALEALSE
jgi:hypothetical protein